MSFLRRFIVIHSIFVNLISSSAVAHVSAVSGGATSHQPTVSLVQVDKIFERRRSVRGGDAKVTGKRVAIVAAGSFMRYHLNSTIRHLIRPLVGQGHQADLYVSLTYDIGPPYRSDLEYMQHLTWDPVFDTACGDETNESDIRTRLHNVDEACTKKHISFIKSEIQKNGGFARKIVLRKSISIDDHPLVVATRATAMSLHPDEDPDLRFPSLDLRRGEETKIANANRNMLTLFLNYQQLWDEVVKSETDWEYDYVMFLRDDTLWLSDFDLNHLIGQGHADFYALSCDARIPPMQPSEINDHGGVVSRRQAELFGNYFNHLFHANVTKCHIGDPLKTGGIRGCNSEMILRWMLTQGGVSTQEVGQKLLPFQRSVHVKKSGGGAAVCFHKYCQSHRDSLETFGLQKCTDMSFDQV